MASLRSIFSNVNGASFVAIDTETVVPLKGGKSNPMKGRVTKQVTGSSVMVFQNKNTNAYEAMVQRRLTAEGKNPEDFQLSPRTWGERIENLPIVTHNKDGETRFYLEVIFLKAGTVEFFLDGSPIARNQIVGLDETEEGRQGGLENKVVIRTFSLDSIKAIRIDHQQYTAPFTF
jgi:hypothetical protein